MRMLRHKLSLVLLVATGGSMLVNAAFFYGMLLFCITFFSYSYLVTGMTVELDEISIKNTNKFIFLPVFIMKFAAIGIISYYVLIYLKGNPFWYVGGFGIGLIIFAVGSLVRKSQARDSEDSDRGDG